jgi:hypothetical protein
VGFGKALAFEDSAFDAFDFRDGALRPLRQDRTLRAPAPEMEYPFYSITKFLLFLSQDGINIYHHPSWNQTPNIR